jgi:hypothetical protein
MQHSNEPPVEETDHPVIPARPRQRVGAALVDVLLAIVIFGVVAGMIANANADGADDIAASATDADKEYGILFGIFATLLVVDVSIVLMAAFRLITALVFGTSPGRWLADLEVISDAESVPPGRGRLLLRDLGNLGAAIIPPVNLIWAVSVLSADEGSGMIDGLTGTRVVRRPAPPPFINKTFY